MASSGNTTGTSSHYVEEGARPVVSQSRPTTGPSGTAGGSYANSRPGENDRT